LVCPSVAGGGNFVSKHVPAGKPLVFVTKMRSLNAGPAVKKEGEVILDASCDDIPAAADSRRR
jgi:hypothetical protein